MKKFMEEAGYLDQNTVAAMVGVNPVTFNRWLNHRRPSQLADFTAERFLDDEGQQLSLIHTALRKGSTNRIELHKKRSVILSKMRIHPTANQRVSSLKQAV
jgi:hypothetical protein